MKVINNECGSVTSEMVEKIIEEHYASGTEKVDLILNRYKSANKPAIDIDRIIAEIRTDREKLAENVSIYEEELVRMIDLATVLSEKNLDTSCENMKPYIRFLLEKNKEILPDIIEIIQLLKK